MVSTARQTATYRGPGSIGLYCLFGYFGSMLPGCAILYPELSTPVRGVITEDRYEPPPPKDVVFVAIKAARIPLKTRDGRSWDKLGGSAPDVYALLFVDGQETLRTAVVSNSFRPVWQNSTPVNLRIPHSAKVRLEVWDDNALVSHPICNETVRNLQDAADVGEIEIECASGASAVLTVEAPKARLGIGLFYDIRGKDAFVSHVVAASAAGRAGLRTDDQILSVAGRSLQQMATGELESIFNGESSSGIALKVRSENGEIRQIALRDEPMYPVKGEGIELKVETTAD